MELDFTWELHHQRMGRESVSVIHEVHEPFDEMFSVHAAWDVGEGGACTENISPNGARFIWHPNETLKSTPPRETTFCEGYHNTPTHILGGSQSSPLDAVGGRRQCPRRGGAMSTRHGTWHGAPRVAHKKHRGLARKEKVPARK